MAAHWVRAAALAVAAACALAMGAPAAVRAAPFQAEREATEAFSQALEALNASRWDRAEILLERVLMLLPEHVEARIELARLMARRGQMEGARELIQSLAEDPRTPEDFRQRLRAMASSLEPAVRAGGLSAARAGPQGAAPSTEQRAWRAELSYTASTNPLARTDATDLTLTSVDGSVTLPLADRPVAGGLTGVTLAHVQSAWGLEVAAQQLTKPSDGSAWRATAWGLWPWPQAWQPLPPGHFLQWGAQAQQGFDGQRRMALNLAWVGPQARLSLSRYVETAQTDHGLVLRWDQRLPLPAAWQGLASLERSLGAAPTSQDTPSRRPGHWRLGLAAEVPWGPQRRLQAQWSLQQDSSPYSPLLENNATRWLTTATVAVEQQWRWGPETGFSLRAYAGARRSNLVLFAYREAGVQASVARAW